MYKPLRIPNDSLTNVIRNLMDKCLSECKCIYLMGDLNVDLTVENHALNDIFVSYDLKNVIEGPTCHKSTANPTLIDIIVTNSPRRVASQLNSNIDIRDTGAFATDFFRHRTSRPPFPFATEYLRQHYFATHITLY